MANLSAIKLPNGTTYTLKDNNALPLTGGSVTGPVSFGDSVSIDEATIGDLVVNGNTSFVQGIKANQIVPFKSKTFTDVIGTANNWAGATFFFGSIKPTSWVTTWRIRYKINVYVPNHLNYRQVADVMVTGTQGVHRSFYSFNTIGPNHVCYYHELYRLKEAGFTNGYGHSLGVRFYSSNYPTSADYKRTIEIEIYELTNCTFDFYDNCLLYASIPGTGSTNYDTYTEIDFINNGLQETGDANDANYQNRIYYSSSTAKEVTYRYQFILRTKDKKLLPVSNANNTFTIGKTYTTTPFDPFGEIYYYNSTSTISVDGNFGNYCLYRQILADLRYSFDVDTSTNKLIARKPVFMTATLQSDGMAVLTANGSIWGVLTQSLPSTDDGLIYIYLGQAYEDTDPYRIELMMHHPIYWYKNGAVRPYIGEPLTVNGHTVNSDVPANANFTDTKVNMIARGTTKAYLLGTTTAPTSSTQAVTSVGETGVYFDTTAATLVATTFKGALTGTASGNLTSSSTLNAANLSGAIPSAVTATTQASTDNSTKIATTAYVTTAIANLPEPMIFKGSVGTGGTITSLPTAAASNEGWTYKVITALSSPAAKVGDTVISNGSSWVVIPSGDEPSGTVTSIAVGTGLNTTSNDTTTDGGTITSSGTIYLTKSGVTAGSYGDSAAQTPGYGSTFKVPYITVDKYGRVTGISEHTVKIPASDNTNTTYTLTNALASHKFTWTLTPSSGSTTTTTAELVQGSGITLTDDTSNKKITIANAGVTGVKGNAESSYRTGQVNLTAANINAYEIIPFQRGTTDISIRPLISRARANRLAFLPPSQVIIEKTIDGGATWIDAGYTDAQKIGIFVNSGSIDIPLLNNAKSELCGLRVTITGMRYEVPDGTLETDKYSYWNSDYVLSQERYFNVREWWFWISANSDTIRCEIQAATGANSTTWKNIFNSEFHMTGWSGSDWIRAGGGASFGGGVTQTSNYWNWRLIFWSRKADNKETFQSASTQSINIIQCYGDSVWSSSNSLMSNDHLYSYDSSQNATFPAKVTASGGFSGNLTGNVTGNITGTATGNLTSVQYDSTNTKLTYTKNGSNTDIVTVATLKSAFGSMPASDVYSWAKASTKPSYTASEVGALASNTTYVSTVSTSAGAHSVISSTSGAVSFKVPTKTSHLTNDSGFITSYTDEKLKVDAITSSGTYYPVLSTNSTTAETKKYDEFFNFGHVNGTEAYIGIGKLNTAVGKIRLYTAASGGKYGIITPGTLSGTRTYTLPDTTGIIALSYNITGIASGTSPNVFIKSCLENGSLPYDTIFTARISAGYQFWAIGYFYKVSNQVWGSAIVGRPNYICQVNCSADTWIEEGLLNTSRTAKTLLAFSS